VKIEFNLYYLPDGKDTLDATKVVTFGMDILYCLVEPFEDDELSLLGLMFLFSTLL
jgi:hypothetical protein